MVDVSVIPNEAVDPRPQATSSNLGCLLGKAIDYHLASAMMIFTGDGVRLKSLPDSKLPAANDPYRRGFPRGGGLLFPRPPSGGPAPEGFFSTALNTARTGSISAFQLDQQFG